MEWTIVTGIVIISGASACILWAKQLAKRTFLCEKCKKDIRFSWKKLLFAVHSYDRYEIRCPHCDHKGCIEKKQ